MTRADLRQLVIGAGLGCLVLLLAWCDWRFDWFPSAFHEFARLFHEQSPLSVLREPTQMPLARFHLAILGLLVSAGLIISPWIGRHGCQCWSVLVIAYATRALIWTIGGNMPLVPGDSCHYIEVATSVYRGEGAVKHYVESYFLDYPEIRRGEGILDDWATPLWAYVLATVYRTLGIVPGASMTSTFAVAKGTSFILNLLCLPALYGFARRRFDASVALLASGILAVLPVHAIYAGFALRESLVALTSILAIWFLSEIGAATGAMTWLWAIAAGVFGGLAILARNTAMALMAAGGLYGLISFGRRRWLPLILWGIVLIVVISPWAWLTYRRYGEPFFTYTKYFEYNFSWTVHHFDRGNTRPDQFYTAENMPGILREKLKSALVLAFYPLMILSFPVVLGFAHRILWPPENADRRTDRLVLLAFLVFAVATLAKIADVTQVRQLGRYYLPVFVLMLPTASAGLLDWLRASVIPSKWSRVFVTIVFLLWASPSWAYDAGWLSKPYQLHWASLVEAGQWIRDHPEKIPENARILTWFPWETRVTSNRASVLFPRSLEAGNYEVQRIQDVVRDYEVTHILWGSFEPSPHSDPEWLGQYLKALRETLGLTASNELYQSPPSLRYPVRLYSLRRGSR